MARILQEQIEQGKKIVENAGSIKYEEITPTVFIFKDSLSAVKTKKTDTGK